MLRSGMAVSNSVWYNPSRVRHCRCHLRACSLRGDRTVEIVLPLDEMTVEEKLRAMERIWEDLCRNESALTPPPWHRDVLEARELRVREGQDRFSDWDEAKRRLRGYSR